MAIRFPQVPLDADSLDRLHKAVLQLEWLFPGCDIVIEQRQKPADLARQSAAVQVASEPTTIRGKVLAATKDIPATVDGIAKATGLDPKKIRGVLTAPDLEFSTDRVGGVVAYKFVRTKDRIRSKKPAAQNGEP